MATHGDLMRLHGFASCFLEPRGLHCNNGSKGRPWDHVGRAQSFQKSLFKEYTLRYRYRYTHTDIDIMDRDVGIWLD